jgi:hypothetical protein
MRSYVVLALLLMLVICIGCEPPRRGQAGRGKSNPPTPPGEPPTPNAPSTANGTLATDPSLRKKVVGIWTNSTGPAGTGTTYSFMDSGEYQTRANVAGQGEVVVSGKWELAGDMIQVKIAQSSSDNQETILYKVRKADPEGLVLVKNQKEVVVLFRL